LSTSKYSGNLPILNALWSVTRDSMDRMKQRFKTSKVTGKLHDRLTGKSPKNPDAISKAEKLRNSVTVKASDTARWAKNGMLDQLQKLTGTEGKENLENILKNSKLLGSNTLKNMKLQQKGSALMSSGSRKLKTVLKGTGGFARLLWAGQAMAGPIGWLAAGIEALGVHLIASTIGEFIERWLFQRQSCLIAPLTKSGLEYSAGINGHKGSVVGDSPDFWQSLMTNDISSLLLGFIGVDTQQFSQSAREGEVSASASSSKDTVDLSHIASTIFKQFRKPLLTIDKLQELYDDDRKAALEQLNKRLALLASRETKAVHDEEQTTWDEWKSKIASWFGGLWDKVKELVSGSSGTEAASVCIPKGDVSKGGKAKGLSKYFSVIGPKIEAECKKQGIEGYAEIVKAKCMQESGGNYVKYPDVMQASESMGKPIGYIKNVDQSISQGVKYFGSLLRRTKGDIKMCIQSYNFGGGFIDYCMKRGGKYTPQLAYSFAEMMAKKHGRISRIPPGYGDSKYVERVLRYYGGDMPNGECENSDGGAAATGGASSCPSVLGKEGKKKYQTSGAGLIDLKSFKGRNFGITIVGGTSKVRQATAETLVNVRKIYGKDFNITSGNRPGDPNWHGTGWAADIDTPNTMRTINGKMRFPNGKDKDEARKLANSCCQAGFRGIVFGDWDIVQELNKKYGSGTAFYDPAGHYNHLHCSYPICKKK
jgi:Lysozyme-like